MTRSSKLQQWTPTKEEEMEKFIGLLIYMGLVSLAYIQLYWFKSSLYSNTFAQKTMYKDSFLFLLQMVHFYKSEPAVGKDIKIKKMLSIIL